ncbi:integrase, catalytic region, zinc finger, CCHC-type containing protein [Tanacetum coccineum]
MTAWKQKESSSFRELNDKFFEIQVLKAQLQDKNISISELKKLIAKLKGKSVETKFEKSSVIRQQNAFKCQKQSILVIPTISVSRPQLKRNPLEDRVLHNNSQGKKQEVEDRHRIFKFTNNKTSVTACNDNLNVKTTNVKFVCLIEIILFIVDSRCSKHMMGNLKLLSNFVEKLLGTVKFRNAQIAPILGYGDLVQGNVTIKRVYYVEGLNHNLFSFGQFCDADLKVAFWKSTCYIHDLKGNDLLTGSCGTYLYSINLQDTSTPNPICLMAKASSSKAWLWHRHLSRLNFDTINLFSKYDIKKGMEFLNKTLHAYFAKEGIEHQTSTARPPKQNGVVKRQNHTLVEAARTMLSAAKVPLFFWAEAIAMAYGENLDKMKEKGDACIFVGYSLMSRGYRVYNKRTRQIVETIHVNFDEFPLMASDHVSSDLVPQCPTTALKQVSLSPDPQSQENVPHVAEIVTTSNELDFLFSLMFDELLNGTTLVVSKYFIVNAADPLDQRQQQNTTPSTSTTIVADTHPLNIQTTPETTCQAPSQIPTVIATKNTTQA